jgi:hypothetical protein
MAFSSTVFKTVEVTSTVTSGFQAISERPVVLNSNTECLAKEKSLLRFDADETLKFCRLGECSNCLSYNRGVIENYRQISTFLIFICHFCCIVFLQI